MRKRGRMRHAMRKKGKTRIRHAIRKKGRDRNVGRNIRERFG